MPKTTTVYRIMVEIGVNVLSNWDLGAFFDMMRYDAATVETSVFDSESKRFRITLRRRDYPHTIERWNSFGIYPESLPEQYTS